MEIPAEWPEAWAFSLSPFVLRVKNREPIRLDIWATSAGVKNGSATKPDKRVQNRSFVLFRG